jgi:quinol monooxygenase YgiN
MILIVVKHPLRAKYADDWPQITAEFTAATRAEPGNIAFEWFRSLDDPTVYLLVEMFRDHAAGEAHVGSDHFKAAMGQMGHAYAAVPQIVNVEAPGDGWAPMGEAQARADEE